LTATSSAVNGLTFANAATANDPTWTASGTDTNIGIKNALKGTGLFTVTDDPGASGRTSIAFVNTNGTSKASVINFYSSGTQLWAIGNDGTTNGANDLFVYDVSNAVSRMYFSATGPEKVVMPATTIFGWSILTTGLAL